MMSDEAIWKGFLDEISELSTKASDSESDPTRDLEIAKDVGGWKRYSSTPAKIILDPETRGAILTHIDDPTHPMNIEDFCNVSNIQYSESIHDVRASGGHHAHVTRTQTKEEKESDASFQAREKEVQKL